MRVRVKPSKATSIVSIVAGLVLIVFGITLVIPKFGAFGVAWTLVAIVIVGYHVFNIVSRRGVAVTEMDVEGFDSGSDDDSSSRLQHLENLRATNLITEQEYQRKRAEIVARL